jgi:hypothetical protein
MDQIKRHTQLGRLGIILKYTLETGQEDVLNLAHDKRQE